MKPLLRQYFYDKLRKSLYHHELKTKVWNNPYFPFLTPESYEDLFDNVSGITRKELEGSINYYNKQIKLERISAIEQYFNFIKKVENEVGINPIDTVYKYYGSGIIEDIEKRYG